MFLVTVVLVRFNLNSLQSYMFCLPFTFGKI